MLIHRQNSDEPRGQRCTGRPELVKWVKILTVYAFPLSLYYITYAGTGLIPNFPPFFLFLWSSRVRPFTAHKSFLSADFILLWFLCFNMQNSLPYNREGIDTVLSTFKCVVFLFCFPVLVVLGFYLIKYASFHSHLLWKPRTSWDTLYVTYQHPLRKPLKIYEVKNQMQVNTQVCRVYCLSRLCFTETQHVSVLQDSIT
jgi:hypothetical protein